MSNVNAVAIATEGLKAILQRAFEEAGEASVPGAAVSSVRPNAISSEFIGVNVFLFQVTPNAALRNEDLPTRRANGELMRRPQLAIDLHYLLSFIGSDSTLDPQRVLGAATAGLHAHPELTPDDIEAIANNAPPQSYLRMHNDLAQQVERVRFTLAPLNVEELSKLWAMFPQKHYELSVAVQASVVLLEAPLTPLPARRVSDRGIYTGMPEPPVLHRVEPQLTPRTVYTRRAAPLPPLAARARVVMAGAALRGQLTRVRFADLEPVPALVAEDGRVEVTVPDALPAGIHTVRVFVAHSFSSNGVARDFELESNALPFVLEPRIIRDASTLDTEVGGEITVGIEPAIAPYQRVRVIAGNQQVTWAPPPGGPHASFAIELPEALEEGTWPLRVEVDGATGTLVDPPANWFSGDPPAAAVEVEDP